MIAPPARMISPPSIRSVPPPRRSMSTRDRSPPSKTTRVTNVRVRTVEVRPAPHGTQVRLRRAQTPAAVDVPVERGEALLSIPVDVLGEVVAGLLARLEERPEQRVGRWTALEDERAVVAAPRVVGRAPRDTSPSS